MKRIRLVSNGQPFLLPMFKGELYFIFLCINENIQKQSEVNIKIMCKLLIYCVLFDTF